MGKVEYTARETQLLKILRSGKKTTLSEFVSHVYNDGDLPGYPRESVRNALSRLAGKVKRNREGFAIWHDERQGPKEVGYWAE